MELRPGAFSQVRGNRGKRHSLSRNHGDTAEDLLFSEGWFRLRGRLKIRARGREACRASNALQKRIVDIPFRCHPATILAADRSCRSDHNSLMEWELIDLTFLSDFLVHLFKLRPEMLKSNEKVDVAFILEHNSLDTLLSSIIERKVISLSF